MKGWSRLLAWTGLMLLLGVAPVLAGWVALPETVATHWGASGIPDGSMSRSMVFVIPILTVAIGLLTTSFLRVGGKPSAEGVAIIGLMGGVAAWISFSIVMLNKGATSWQDAAPFGLWQLIGVMIVAGAGGWGGYLLGRKWYPIKRIGPDTNAPVLDLAEGEKATWVGTTKVKWPFFVLGPVAVVFLFLPGWFKAIAPLYLVLAFLFAQVMVTVDDDGLRVVLGGLFTVKRVVLDKVVVARPIDLEPAQWGGWGYRVIAGGSSIVLRRGDAIEVLMDNDRRFAVSVDDAATGAALLNGLVQRRARKS